MFYIQILLFKDIWPWILHLYYGPSLLPAYSLLLRMAPICTRIFCVSLALTWSYQVPHLPKYHRFRTDMVPFVGWFLCLISSSFLFDLWSSFGFFMCNRSGSPQTVLPLPSLHCFSFSQDYLCSCPLVKWRSLPLDTTAQRLCTCLLCFMGAAWRYWIPSVPVSHIPRRILLSRKGLGEAPSREHEKTCVGW